MKQIKIREDRIFTSLTAAFSAVMLLSVLLFLLLRIGGHLNLNPEAPTSPPQNSLEEPSASLPAYTSPQSSAILKSTPDAGEDYLRNIIFVGDSTTAHLRSRGVLPDGKNTKQVWCPSNNTLLLTSEITSLRIVYPDTGEELTIPEAAALKKPDYMVFTIGLNGSSTFTEALYKGCYQKLITAVKEASPGTKIILQSVFPVAENQDHFSLSSTEVNANVRKINAWQVELAEALGVYYLDTYQVLLDDKQHLIYAYQNGDGIHLTADAYQIILHYIRTHKVPA